MTSVSPTREGYPTDLRALTSLRAFLAVGVVLLSGYPVAFCLGGVALMFGIGGLLEII